MRVENKSFYADLFSKPAGADGKPASRLVLRAVPLSAPSSIPSSILKPRPRPRPRPAALPALPALPAPENPPQVKAEKGDITARSKTASLLAELIGDVDTHNLTPRRMSDLSLDLYAAGAVSYEDYSLLAFQPELHPDFNRTIGALTGEVAEPDRPRDFVHIWDDRAAFQRRHNAARRDLIEQSERIADVLRRIDSPANVMA